MSIHLTSRTAALTYQDCPRRRFLAFHVQGHGISGSRINLDTFIGSVVHRGLQNLLEHAKVDHEGDTRLLKRNCINQSVNVANRLFFQMLENSTGFMQKSDDYTEYDFKVAEAWALCEALIRSYAMWRLPLFGEFYEVLEVEKEEEYWLENPKECELCEGKGFRTRYIGVNLNFSTASINNEGIERSICIECDGSGFTGGILFQAKADGLLRGRQDNKLYVLSFKTARDFTDLTMKQIMHDMQGMSEIAAIEDRLGKWWEMILVQYEGKDIELSKIPALQRWLLEQESRPECHAVQYEYLLKGRYQQDPWNSGFYKWQNPLIHCWKNAGVQNLMTGTRSGIDYKWKASPGRQPKGWEKINIWETGEPNFNPGIEAWLDMLMQHEVQPEEGDVFQNIFRAETINRRREDIEEWKVSTFYQEMRIRNYLYDLSIGNGMLETYFPKHTNRCHDFYGNDCPFVQICHQSITVTELLEEGVFSPRNPHHQKELDEFKKKGYLK